MLMCLIFSIWFSFCLGCVLCNMIFIPLTGEKKRRCLEIWTYFRAMHTPQTFSFDRIPKKLKRYHNITCIKPSFSINIAALNAITMILVEEKKFACKSIWLPNFIRVVRTYFFLFFLLKTRWWFQFQCQFIWITWRKSLPWIHSYFYF